jgi:NADPH2:quinone reductase
MPRAWLLPASTGYKTLKLGEVPLAQPGPGEIRLKVEAFALNWGDMDLCWDRYSFSFPKFPTPIGIEAAGIVDAIGPGVSGIALGSRYCTLPYFYYNRGASTDTLVIHANYVTPAPKSLSAVESASIWMQYMTAYFPLAEIKKVGKGDCVLVTAATSTAGAAALEIGRILGATMIGTTRFEKNSLYLREMGADHVVVTKKGEGLDGGIKTATGGKGVIAVFDPVGASLTNHYSKALAKGATIFFYGFLDSKFPTLPFIDMFQANATFHTYSLFNYVEDPVLCRKGTDFVHKMIEAGELKPRIDRVFPMEQYVEAFDYLASVRDGHGKVVVKTGL